MPSKKGGDIIYSYEQSPYQRNKSINAWQKCKIRTGFEPGTPGRKANTITTELRRFVSNADVRDFISIGKQPCLKKWSSVTYPLLKSSFIDDGKPIR